MKIKMKFLPVLKTLGVTAILAGAVTFGAAPHAAYAQGDAATPPNVTLDLRDAPIRAALEQIFNSAKVNFAIDPQVTGYVNLKVTDIPFENALRLILRSSTTPLTYSKDSGVYIVKLRTTDNPTPTTPDVPEPPVRQRSNFETIELTYVDPADLVQLLGIKILKYGVRNQSTGGSGGSGGGSGFGGGGFGGGSGGGGGFGGGSGGGGGFGGGGGGFGGGGGGGGLGGIGGGRGF